MTIFRYGHDLTSTYHDAVGEGTLYAPEGVQTLYSSILSSTGTFGSADASPSLSHLSDQRMKLSFQLLVRQDSPSPGTSTSHFNSCAVCLCPTRKATVVSEIRHLPAMSLYPKSRESYTVQFHLSVSPGTHLHWMLSSPSLVGFLSLSTSGHSSALCTAPSLPPSLPCFRRRGHKRSALQAAY